MNLRHQSSAMCIIMLGGEDTPVVCNESREPHTSHYTNNKKTTNKLLKPDLFGFLLNLVNSSSLLHKLLKPATMQLTGRNFFKAAMI